MQDYTPYTPTPRLFPLKTGRQAPHVFVEPSLFYHPPYETDAEDELAYQLVKHLVDSAGLRYRVRMHTSYASFGVDFLIEVGRMRVAVSCTDDTADEMDAFYHDTLMLDAGLADIVYRFSSRDVEARVFDCLCLMARCNPALFSERGLPAIEAQATPAARAFRPELASGDTRMAVVLPPVADEWAGESFVWPSEEAGTVLACTRMSRQQPAGWMRDVEDALAHFGITAAHVAASWSRSA